LCKRKRGKIKIEIVAGRKRKKGRNNGKEREIEGWSSGRHRRGNNQQV
jgi:hypothetical protein